MRSSQAWDGCRWKNIRPATLAPRRARAARRPDTCGSLFNILVVLATRALLGGLLVPVRVLRRGNRAIEPALERGVLGLEGL